MSSGFYRICNWIWKLAYLNLLWIAFTILGLGIFGFLPATVAMFSIMRKWLMGNGDADIFVPFIMTYKKEFIKINILGCVFLAGAYLIYFNYLYLGTVNGFMHTFLALGWYASILFYFITLCYVIPAYIHYDMKLFQYIKVALIIGIVNPLAFITLVISLGLLAYLFYLVPGLIPFFGVSLLGFIIMWSAHLSFNRVEVKKERLAPAQ
jgi:uncharacterized membrane protein YesL